MTIKNLYPAVRPSLDINFAGTKRLDPRIAFSRVSTGMYVDDDGLIKMAASGVARFDHDLTTRESLGLLVEEARTNYFHAFDSPNYNNNPATYSPYVDSRFGGLERAHSWTFSSTKSNTELGWFNPGGISTTGNGVQYIISFWAKANQAYTLVGNLVDERRTSISFYAALTTEWKYFSFSTPPNVNDDGSGTVYFRWLKAVPVPAGLRLDFAAVNLEIGGSSTSYIPTLRTFTSRASTATFYDANGIIQTAGINVARDDAFLPDSDGVMRSAGLLIEGAGTNLLNGSQTFAASGGTQNNWTDTNITRDGTLRASPDNTANALRITAASGDATIISSAAIGTSANRTFSIFLRRVTGTGDIQYTLDNGSSWATQTITSSWRRYIFPATTADQQVGIKIVASGDAIELWGAQLEAGLLATSYIPTTTTTVTRSADVRSTATATRSADVAQIAGSNFSSWYNNAEWTLTVKTGAAVSSSLPDLYYLLSLGGFSDYGIVTASSATLAFRDGPTISPSARSAGIYGFSFGSSQMSATYNGQAVNISPTTFSSVNATSLQFSRSDNLLSANVPISRLTYWPARLSDATLQAITR